MADARTPNCPSVPLNSFPRASLERQPQTSPKTAQDTPKPAATSAHLSTVAGRFLFPRKDAGAAYQALALAATGDWLFET